MSGQDHTGPVELHVADRDPVDVAAEQSGEDYEDVWGPVADEMEVGAL